MGAEQIARSRFPGNSQPEIVERAALTSEIIEYARTQVAAAVERVLGDVQKITDDCPMDPNPTMCGQDGEFWEDYTHDLGAWVDRMQQQVRDYARKAIRQEDS